MKLFGLEVTFRLSVPKILPRAVLASIPDQAAQGFSAVLKICSDALLVEHRGWTLEHIGSRGCGASISANIQNPFGRGPGQPVVPDPA